MGAFALEMTQLPAVKEFAQTMIRDHGGANKLATELGKRADIPFDSVHIIDDDPKAKLVRESLDQMNEMRKLQGAEFDKGYLQREVEFHEDVLKDLDDDLIPNAKNAELRGFLEQIRPTVSSHLERAKQLKDELDRGAVPAGTQP
jgi:putative membrane protein